MHLQLTNMSAMWNLVKGFLEICI